MASKSASGGNAERPIVLKSPGGQVEISGSDSRGRYSITVTDRRSGKVELRLTADGDRYADARAITAEYANDGGQLSRQP